MKLLQVLVIVSAATGFAGAIQAADTISFNFATASGTGITPSNGIDVAESAGATGYSVTNWNNLTTDWSGNAGAIPSPILDSNGSTVSGLGIGYDAPNAWNNGIATTTGDQKLMRNYLDSGTADSPYVTLTGIPYRKFDVVVYADGDGGSGQVDGPYVIRYGTTTSGVVQWAQQTEAALNRTNLLRPAVWLKESGNFSGTYTAVSTTNSLSVAGALTGNYMVFGGLKGNITIDPTQTTGTSRAPLNGFQIVKWETTNVMPGADDATAKVALYSGHVTVAANRTIGSLATSVGTYGDLIINAGVTLTLANGDLDMGDINHWIKGGGSLTSGNNTLTIIRDISAGLSYVTGATDAAINGVALVNNGATPLNVVKTGPGKLRMSTGNPYTGTTTISQGSIEIGNAAALGAASSAVVLNDAQTSFFDTGLYLQNGVTLTRTITVANSGAGNPILGSLDAGTQAFSGQITLNKTAQFSPASGSTVTANGTITGAGGLTKTGAGKLVVNANNSLTGNVAINSGTVTVNSGKSLAWASATKAGTDSLVISGGGVLEMSVWGGWGTTGPLGQLNYNNGFLRINNGTIRMMATDTFGDNRGINIDTGGATLEATSGITWVLGGGPNTLHGLGTLTLTGAGNGTANIAVTTSNGIVKAGPGTWTLTAANAYAGPTLINAGKLIVNGSIAATSAVTVNLGGTLGGTGAVGAVTIANGGTIAPGNSAGVFNTGNLTLASGALLAYELDTPSTSDKVIAAGALTLTGQQFSDFAFTLGGGFNQGVYTLIDATSVSGALGAGTSGVLSGLPSTLSISGNDLILTVVPEPSTWMLVCLALVPLFLRRRKI